MAGPHSNGGATIETLMLPVSRLALLWRSDGCYRLLEEDNFFDDDIGIDADCDDWARWTGEVNLTGRVMAMGGGSGWWVFYGERPPGADVTFRLADGTEPEIGTIGGVWACEWVSEPQDAEAVVGGRTYPIPYRPPHYLT
jgi:hypothetical protein